MDELQQLVSSGVVRSLKVVDGEGHHVMNIAVKHKQEQVVQVCWGGLREGLLYVCVHKEDSNQHCCIADGCRGTLVAVTMPMAPALTSHPVQHLTHWTPQPLTRVPAARC